MFVRFMYADEWQDQADLGVNTVAPTWNDIRKAVTALDGNRHTMVLLSDDESSDAHMCISGQWDGRVMVYMTKDNLDFFSIVDPTYSQGSVTLCVGGQNGVFDMTKCVPLAWAQEAAEHFFETGEMIHNMNWTKDN